MNGLLCCWDAMRIKVVLLRYCCLMDLEWQWCLFYQLGSVAILLWFLHCFLDSSLLFIGVHGIFGIQIMWTLAVILGIICSMKSKVHVRTKKPVYAMGSALVLMWTFLYMYLKAKRGFAAPLLEKTSPWILSCFSNMLACCLCLAAFFLLV